MKSEKGRRAISLTVYLLLVPACVALGATVFRDRAYIWISVCLAVLSCVPFFARFENRPDDTRRMAVLAAMTALSVLGRFLFYAVPHFKPVTAMVVICGIYLGAESGFLCGALTAILSNILFGQGPWTPFQMMVWGIIGFLAGVLARQLKKSRAALFLYGALAGVLFSFLMDIWTVMWWDGKFSLSRYIAAIVSAAPVTAVYALSNVLFLSVLITPIGKKLERLVTKYGI